jgi:MerR family Zn(II)-responsive transcriptional regulator of zntA
VKTDESGRGAALTTGDLARRTGNTLRTVRFYEEAGILRPARAPGGRRLFTAADLERLQLITDLRELDLPLDEIRKLLELREGCADGAELASRFGEVLSDQLAKAERRVVALRRLQEDLGSALEVLDICRRCEGGPGTERCTTCEVATGEGAPRVMRVVVGGGGTDRP